MSDSWGYLIEEMEQVEYLQQSVVEMMWDATQQNDMRFLLEYYHHFYALMEKQSILWTRLKLMQQPKLEGILIAIEQVCDALGKPPNMTVQNFHTQMRDEIKKSLGELTGEDMDSYDGIDIDFKWK